MNKLKIKLYRYLISIFGSKIEIKKWLNEAKADLLWKTPLDVGPEKTIAMLEMTNHIIV